MTLIRSICLWAILVGIIAGCAPAPGGDDATLRPATPEAAAVRASSSAFPVSTSTPSPSGSEPSAVIRNSPAVAPTVPALAPGGQAVAAPSSATAVAQSSGPARNYAQLPMENHITLGYYVPYDATSWRTLAEQADHLDYVAAQWVSLDACGNLASRDDRTLIAFAQARGIRVMPSLLTMDQATNHRLLTDMQVRDRAIEQIVSYVVEEGYDGFDLDLEDVLPADRPAFTDFVAALYPKMREQGKMLMAALPAKAAESYTGWSGAYDYAALAPNLDLVMIMTYDYSWSNSPPGSIGPYKWMDQVMAYVTSKIPARKVLLGIAFYGYDWNTTTGGKARALRYDQAAAIAGKFGTKVEADPETRSATFRYTMKAGETSPPTQSLPSVEHDISVRKPAHCEQPLPSPTARPVKPPTTPAPTRTAAPIQQHVVWLEDAKSVAARLEIADRRGLGGVGAWRLGQEDPAVWSVFAKWKQAP